MCNASRAAHLNLASHLATEAQSIRERRDPVSRNGSWLMACEATSRIEAINGATDWSQISGIGIR
jgi:hypothetical protein